MTITVCSPPQVAIRLIRFCPTCRGRRRFAGHLSLWYGATITCCGCGDTWSAGERQVRPTHRGWRQESRARARATWLAACSRPEWQRWLTTQVAR